MLYILSKEELDNLVPQSRFYDEQKKVEMLLTQFKKDNGCSMFNGGYCDDCPISSLNNQFNRKICHSERYSK